ncbi:DISARM system SNF2-like helicase DrmD [Roseovarius sp. EGI FJ00037]|uniref:DISARM system SNF2-like helicase DrmD n=1 Tax=Roseovarius salincola TaxID=2978479 RepID=UPI0022A8B8F1|nr:DISARM system SNF2-like helicase DrmD [Roseovarius sp. EGI FJ00037]MCZ0811877.1 DISARM system SNF2-like helicase DrmD [Roseovarius sp. EGI FJ00037]
MSTQTSAAAVPEDHPVIAVPEPGQLVEVRRRQWVVADVIGSTLTGAGTLPQHLLTLSSIDDDNLGEEIEVVWELEPGAHVIEKAGLPSITGQDDTTELEAFLDAVRWGAATNADRGFLQAPFRSGVSIEDFQLDPMVRAIEMARANLLIADDVGLGKTIEAGLVIQELLLRHRARTALVVCPASLQEKWRVEMLEKFGLEFRIVNTDYIKQLRRDRGIHANPWTSYPRLITSIDWLKAGDPLRMMRDVLPVHPTYPRKFDILVVDEAHNVAPAGSANYVIESQRTRLIRRIAPHFQHRLFLTATPHNGYTESFTSLLELLDNQRFSRNIMPDERQLSQVMVRRLKTDLIDSDGKPLYPRRCLKALSVPFTDDERSIHATLDRYCKSREGSTDEKSHTGTKFVNTLLKKRLFSSPAAFASTLEKHIQTVTSGARSQDANVLGDRILRRAIMKAEEDYADDRQAEAAQEEAIQEASKRSAPLTDEQHALIDRMRDWAQRAANKPDSKAKAIVSWIEENLRENGKWNERRVILFTEYRSTHQWLQRILASHDFGGDRLATIHGGMDQEEREKVKAAFQTNPKDSDVRILLATDAAAEGIDLQNYCNCLIHVEIPYNPNVMEQRNGRIDRHGQKYGEVLIWHPVDGGAAEGDSLGGHEQDIIRALTKLESMREDMGSVNPVIAPQMAGLIEGTRKQLDTRVAEARAAKARKFVRAERELKDRIAKLHDRLMETRKDFHLTPDRICAAVKTGLALAERPALEPVHLDGAPAGTVFNMPALTGSWSRCMEGLRHPHTGTIRPITFDHGVAKGRDDVVLVHLNHRLVQMCLRLMRAEIWAQDDVKRLHRVDVRAIPDALLETPAAAVVSRLVITGGNHHRLHEELTVAGGYLRKDTFAREQRVTRVNEWLEGASPATPSTDAFEALAERFTKFKESIMQTVEARSRDRLRNLENTLGTRKDQEIRNIGTVLDDLSAAIENEIAKDTRPEQLDWISQLHEDERTQVRRDIDALRARLAGIPEEKEREIAAIEARYDGFTARTFPVAVILLLPDSMAHGGAL